MDAFHLPKEFEDFISNPEDLLKQFNSSHIEDALTIRLYRLNETLNDARTLHNLLNDWDTLSQFIKEHSESYIWSKDSIELALVIPDNLEDQIFFESVMRPGDSIEDEWFSTYLMLKLSMEFTDYCISLTDNDGQFLLIEAADCIPDWLDPDSCNNRVWIHRGKIHIVPRDEPELGRCDNGISVAAALHCIAAKSSLTEANRKVQKCIFARTTDIYPARAAAGIQRAACIIPTCVVSLLQRYSKLLSIAVNSFCVPANSKKRNVLASMPRFGSTTGPSDLSVMVLHITRLQYAKLLYQPFHPPKKFHAAMRVVSEQLGSANAMKAFDLGCRIVCGLELAYQASKTMETSKSKYLPLEPTSEKDVARRIMSAVQMRSRNSSCTKLSCKNGNNNGHNNASVEDIADLERTLTSLIDTNQLYCDIPQSEQDSCRSSSEHQQAHSQRPRTTTSLHSSDFAEDVSYGLDGVPAMRLHRAAKIFDGASSYSIVNVEDQSYHRWLHRDIDTAFADIRAAHHDQQRQQQLPPQQQQQQESATISSTGSLNPENTYENLRTAFSRLVEKETECTRKSATVRGDINTESSKARGEVVINSMQQEIPEEFMVDSDAWLYMTPEEMDAEMIARTARFRSSYSSVAHVIDTSTTTTTTEASPASFLFSHEGIIVPVEADGDPSVGNDQNEKSAVKEVKVVSSSTVSSSSARESNDYLKSTMASNDSTHDHSTVEREVLQLSVSRESKHQQSLSADKSASGGEDGYKIPGKAATLLQGDALTEAEDVPDVEQVTQLQKLVDGMKFFLSGQSNLLDGVESVSYNSTAAAAADDVDVDVDVGLDDSRVRGDDGGAMVGEQHRLAKKKVKTSAQMSESTSLACHGEESKEDKNIARCDGAFSSSLSFSSSSSSSSSAINVGCPENNVTNMKNCFENTTVVTVVGSSSDSIEENVAFDKATSSLISVPAITAVATSVVKAQTNTNTNTSTSTISKAGNLEAGEKLSALKIDFGKLASLLEAGMSLSFNENYIPSTESASTNLPPAASVELPPQEPTGGNNDKGEVSGNYSRKYESDSEKEEEGIDGVSVESSLRDEDRDIEEEEEQKRREDIWGDIEDYFDKDDLEDFDSNADNGEDEGDDLCESKKDEVAVDEGPDYLDFDLTALEEDWKNQGSSTHCSTHPPVSNISKNNIPIGTADLTKQINQVKPAESLVHRSAATDRPQQGLVHGKGKEAEKGQLVATGDKSVTRPHVSNMIFSKEVASNEVEVRATVQGQGQFFLPSGNSRHSSKPGSGQSTQGNSKVYEKTSCDNTGGVNVEIPSSCEDQADGSSSYAASVDSDDEDPIEAMLDTSQRGNQDLIDNPPKVLPHSFSAEDEEIVEVEVRDDDDDDDEEAQLEEDWDEEDVFIEEYQMAMERELATTTLRESFERLASDPRQHDDSDTDGEGSGDSLGPINEELNFLKNLLESHASQLGAPGPATQLFSQMGLELPHLPPMNSIPNKKSRG